MSFLLYGVHYPRPDTEGILIAAMHKFGELVRKRPGVVFTDIFKNTKDGTIISLAIWESKQAFEASWPEVMKQTPSTEWEIKAREAHMMDSVEVR